MPKIHNKDFEISIKKLYEQNMTTKEITKKTGATSTYINKVRKLYNLNRNRDNYDEILKKHNLIKKIPFVSATNKKEYMYEIPCVKCSKSKKVLISHINRLEKNNSYYFCDYCSNKGENKIERTCKLKKRKSNTSGYIGVCVKKYKDKIIGYKATLYYGKKRLLNNVYKDEDLREVTLKMAAIDRDIFIIENCLPHARNFTDFELTKEIENLHILLLNAPNNIESRFNSIQQIIKSRDKK